MTGNGPVVVVMSSMYVISGCGSSAASAGWLLSWRTSKRRRISAATVMAANQLMANVYWLSSSASSYFQTMCI